MNKPYRLFAALMLAAAGATATPALAQGPGEPIRHGPSADGPLDAPMTRDGLSFGPMGIGNERELRQLHERIAHLLAVEAMHQRAIGARAAHGRMMQLMIGRLRAMDRNEDGAITEREFLAGMIQIFDRIDKDGDGAIGPAELRTLFAQVGGGMFEGGPGHGPNYGGDRGGPDLFAPNREFHGGRGFPGGPGNFGPRQFQRR